MRPCFVAILVIATLLVATGSAYADAEASTTASLKINTTSLEAVFDTSQQGGTVTFTVYLENTGTLWTTAEPKIGIYRDNFKVDEIDLGKVTLSSGENTTITKNWSPRKDGHYKSILTVVYDQETLQKTSKFNFSMNRKGTVDGGGNPFFPSPSPTDISINEQPILVEVQPGSSTIAIFSIHNPTGEHIEDLQIKTNASRKFGEIGFKGGRISIGPRKTKQVSVPISISRSASPGLYLINFELSKRDNLRLITEDEKASTNFGLRIKKRRNITPTSYREIFLNNNSLDIKINLVNGKKTLNRVEVIETVPKNIAPTIKGLTFYTNKPVILQTDPVLKWTFRNLESFDARTLNYRVNNAGLGKNFETSLSWIEPQLTSFPETRTPPIKLTVQEPMFKTGQLNAFINTLLGVTRQKTLTVEATNLADSEIETVAIFNVPEGWRGKNRLKLTLPPRSVTTVNTQITPPQTVKPGIYEGTAVFTYGGGETKTKFELKVTESPITAYAIFAIIGFLTGVIISLLALASLKRVS